MSTRAPLKLLLLSLMFTGCDAQKAAATQEQAQAQPNQAKAGLPDRDPALAHRLVEEQGALLLDVRSQIEFATGSLPGAKHLPFDEIDERVAEILAHNKGDKQRPIVVFCHAGSRAGRAKESLLRHGFTQVSNLGGMSDW